MQDRPLTVVEAVEQDTDAISTFIWEAWRQAGPGSPGFSGANEEVIAEIADPRVIRARLGGPERRMFIAVQGDRVVGFASTRAETTDTVEVSGVIVLQEMTGSGIGRKLLHAAIEASAGYGFTEMTVNTETDNDGARRFYERHGFEPVGTSVEMVGPTAVQVVTLKRDL